MGLDSNKGTQYYEISSGIPSDAGLVITSNSGTKYYRNSATEFILWGQETQYSPVTSNKGSQYYFLKCAVPSDAGLNLTKNSGTKYYYSSSFNCVPFNASQISTTPTIPPNTYYENIYGSMNIGGVMGSVIPIGALTENIYGSINIGGTYL